MVIAVIPARYASTRFPGKPLAVLAGHPLVEHVHAGAVRAGCCDRVVIATDDQRIAAAVTAFGGETVLTSPDHPCGTDRIVEACASLGVDDDDAVVVNVQGDEPLIRPAGVAAAVEGLVSSAADWSTLVYPLADEDMAASPNLVKAVMNAEGNALYFSRLPIPFQRDGNATVPRFGHIGLYAYRAAALRRFSAATPTPLEQAEKLEQLRALELGMRIHCVCVESAYPGVDTPADLQQAEHVLRQHPELSNLYAHAE
jgi:3-deoxy-manno-octulosonate cytidylyltransferase (CMP-KDO synthetase)